MASTIRVKRSSVAGKIPNTTNISTGELALNLADKRLFSSNGSSTFELGSNPHSLTVGEGGLTLANAAFIEFSNSNIVKFNQMYTGGSSGSYFTNGEYQKVVTITPDGNSQNYQVVGRIVAQNAGETHTVYFNAALRSSTLPDLSFSMFYDEEYNGARYIEPQLWTKETSTAGFILAFKTLATIYGTVTVDVDIVPRTSGQKSNIVVNRVQDSEQSSVDTGFIPRDMTKVISRASQVVSFANAYSFPTTDGSSGQVLQTDGNGTLTFATASGSGSPANTFSTINIAGQDSIFAEQAGDSLTFVAGAGVTLTSNSAADSVTIATTVQDDTVAMAIALG